MGGFLGLKRLLFLGEKTAFDSPWGAAPADFTEIW
jgi:hypothetical protein